MNSNMPESVSARTRSRTRACTNTAIFKASGSINKINWRYMQRKSRKRKMVQVSSESKTNNAKKICLSNKDEVIFVATGNEASVMVYDSERIAAPSNDIDDDDVIYIATVNETAVMAYDSERMAAASNDIHDDDVIYVPTVKETSVMAYDSERMAVASNVIHDDDVIYVPTVKETSVMAYESERMAAASNDIHDDDVIYVPTVNETAVMVYDSERIAATSSDIHDDDVIYVPTVNETAVMGYANSKAAASNDIVNDDVIYVPTGNETSSVMVYDSMRKPGTSNDIYNNDDKFDMAYILIAKETSIIIFDSESKVATENAIDDVVIFVANENRASIKFYDSKSLAATANGIDDDVYHKKFVANGNTTSINSHDSGSKIATGDETSIIANDFGGEDVTGNETSIDGDSESLHESLKESVTETVTTTLEKYCTDVDNNDLSFLSQLSDVSSVSLQSTSNSIKETNPGGMVSKNKKKLFAPRNANRKIFRKKRKMKRLQALFSPRSRKLFEPIPPLKFHKKFFNHSRNFVSSPRIYKRPNQRAVHNKNNYKKRPSAASFTKAINKNPYISKKFRAIKPKLSNEAMYTNPFNSKKYNNNERHKRMVIIDGNNVAFGHSSSEIKEFSVKGIDICLNYFLKMGHEVKAVVPQMRLKHSNSTNSYRLEQLKNEGKLVITPCKSLLNGQSLVSYDDRCILDLALEYDAVIISNDNYRDLFYENEAYKDIIQSRIIGYTFCKNFIWFPDDPYGRNGPLLNEILTKQI